MNLRFLPRINIKPKKISLKRGTRKALLKILTDRSLARTYQLEFPLVRNTRVLSS